MPKAKKKKSFDVYVYYHSCVFRRVEAEDEDDALDKARSSISDEDIMDYLMEEPSPDVYESNDEANK